MSLDIVSTESAQVLVVPGSEAFGASGTLLFAPNVKVLQRKHPYANK